MTASRLSLRKAGDWATRIFQSQKVNFTIGGEPTFVPVDPDGAEWSNSAVGPTKLGYAKAMAAKLLEASMEGGTSFFSPGKQYPGETNPRWAIWLISRRDGIPLVRHNATGQKVTAKGAERFLIALGKSLCLASEWMIFRERGKPSVGAWVLPMDYKDGEWTAVRWKIPERFQELIGAEGPAGLRLPLQLVPPGVPRRALVVELVDGCLKVFFPPVIQAAFADLIERVDAALASARVGRFDLQGYVPSDEAGIWTKVGLTADPGVLEVNMPACSSWEEYDAWIRRITSAAEDVGLRSWKKFPGEHPAGTGGGNHVLWGGPSLDENPFFSRPAWVAAFIRYWQCHPALSYMFTGSYVGTSSQAPRPDESGKTTMDLEMAYSFLESLEPSDHRALINDTLRHLHTDITGNVHRSEISFDKFWNPGYPAGSLGLIEFRAIESLPSSHWMSAIALLWTCLAAFTLETSATPRKQPLVAFGRNLHDRYFLPSKLWEDFEAIMADMAGAGCQLPRTLYRSIWDWRFPVMLKFQDGGAKLEIRRALDDWPLLSETPVEGGTTSRFVDSSMHRIEILATGGFADAYELRVQNRVLVLRSDEEGNSLAALRFRRSALHPCLHPGIKPQMPLHIDLVPRSPDHTSRHYALTERSPRFTRIRTDRPEQSPDPPCSLAPGSTITYDLRL